MSQALQQKPFFRYPMYFSNQVKGCITFPRSVTIPVNANWG